MMFLVTMSESPEGQLWQFKFRVGDLLGQAGVLQVKQEHSEKSMGAWRR